MFQGESSTDEDVIEIPPPINGSSKVLKQTKISLHDVIDLDIEDDHNEAGLAKGSFFSNGKEKAFIDPTHNAINLDDSEICGPYKNMRSNSKVWKKVTSTGGSSTYGDRTPSVPVSVHVSGKRSVATNTSSRKKPIHFLNESTSFGLPTKLPPLSYNLSSPMGSSLFTLGAKSSSMADWMSLSLNSTNCPTLVPSTPSTYVPGFVSASSLAPIPDPRYPTATGKGSNLVQPAAIGQSKSVDEILGRFHAFKKFDMVQDDSGHHYSRNASKMPSKAFVKRIQEEWKSLEKNLPDKIFVRVYESKMDLLRAVIIGAAGTPYHDGLFFFDVYFPSNYPNVPPKVHYHSGGLRINPNLYDCGKVCLSLLNTWTGSGKEKWVPRESTILQVLVSIQGLILNAKPYFNEPGHASSQGTPFGEQLSLQYNEKTFILNLRTMIYSMHNPPKHFEDFVVGYFVQSAEDILVACKTYIDGAQVGSLVSGGVQDVDEGDKSCSDGFKKIVAGCIAKLVDSFTKVGAKDCQKFLHLAEKATSNVSSVPVRVPVLNYH